MPSRKTDVVDNLTVVRLVRLTREGTTDVGAVADLPPAPAPPGAKAGAHFGRTAMPTRHEVRCYECRYEFSITGQAKQTHCPKCRAIIEMQDYCVEGDWAQDVKTAGTIHIAVGATVRDGVLIGGNIVLAGALKGGRVEAYRRLELAAGAQFTEEAIRARDLRVQAGAEIVLRQAASFREVEILGKLSGSVMVTGRIDIRAGGCLEGTARGPRLMVEEGGGLLAELRIGAEDDLPRKPAPRGAP